VFDFRYHVVSLTAVFLALVLGILVGVAISDPELADRIDKRALQDRVQRLEGDLEASRARLQERRAAEAYVDRTFGTLMADRLRGRRIGILIVGDENSAPVEAVETAIETDANGTIARARTIRVPVPDDLAASLSPTESPAELGRELGREFVVGDETPVWDALESELVLVESGGMNDELDGVVLIRAAPPQAGDTARFLRGLYEGLEGAVPAVGVEVTGTDPSVVEILDQFDDFATVDNIDSRVGRLALAVLLAGDVVGGHYGLDAPDGVLPPVEPVPAATDS
jgi:hypothetical protein